jgi:hypothetical protein
MTTTINDADPGFCSQVDPTLFDYWKSHPAFDSEDEIRICLAAVRQCLDAMTAELHFSDESYTKTFLPVATKNDKPA